MSGPGPSKTQQKDKYYKYGRGRGGGRGSGGGRGGGGGGGRGRGGGGGGRGGGHSGPPPWMQEEGDLPRLKALGIYRQSPIQDMFSAPGICVTAIQNKEKSAEREIVNYLEELADELYPETIESDVKEEGDEDLDIEQMLQKELETLKGDKKKSNRFRLCKHETPCVFYVITLPPLNPVQLVYRLLEKVESSAQSPFKYINRLVPITAVGGATLNQLSEVAKPVLRDGFITDDHRALKFAINPNSRNSGRLERLEIIKRVADEVVALGAGHTVDLSNPDRTILIEVHKNSLGISVVRDYARFAKYNPSVVAELAVKKRLAAEGGTTADGQHAAETRIPGPSFNDKRKASAAQINANAAGHPLPLPKRKADDMEMGEIEQPDPSMEGVIEVVPNGDIVDEAPAAADSMEVEEGEINSRAEKVRRTE